ncbi:MAG: hypothetical protein WCC48_03470, partial [Anaeromyxobacteraceae bacterium]
MARMIAVLLSLALAAPAASMPRIVIAIAPVKNDASGQVGAQLARALCTSRRCLVGVLDGRRPDLARARRAGADASLVSSLWREPRGRVLSLALFTSGPRPARAWVLPLGPDGLVPLERLDAFERELDDALGVPLAAAPPSPPRAFVAPTPAPVAAPPPLPAPSPPA